MPYSMDVIGLISVSDPARLEALMSRIVTASWRRYGVPIKPVWRNDRTILFAGEKTKSGSPARFGFAIAGYTTSDDETIERTLGRQLGPDLVQQGIRSPVTIPDSLGGVHCAAVADETGAAIWPSMPGCCPPYYTTGEGYVVACSRPGVLKAALELAPNEDYWRWIASVGYPLDDCSPYRDTYCVLGGTALRVYSGESAIVDYVLPEHGRVPQSTDEAIAAEDVVRKELLRATQAVSKFKNVEFRLSGGKDSRLVASAVAALNLNCTAHTAGKAEATIAEQIATAANIAFVNTVQDASHVATPADLFDRCIAAMRRTDAFVPLQGHNAFTDSGILLPDQEGQMRGQIELHKGGFSKGHARLNRAQAIEQLERSVIPKHAAARSELCAKLAERFKYDQYNNAQDILYFPYAGTRASRYLEVSYKRISYHSTPIFPPNDERMFIAVSNVDRRRRSREQMMYDVTEANAPQIAHIPVYGDNWKFMKGKAPATHLASDTDLGSDRGKPEVSKSSTSIGEVPWARRFMRDYVRSHDGVMEMVREGIGEDYLSELGLADDDNGSLRDGLQRRQRTKIVMRLFILAVTIDNWTAV